VSANADGALQIERSTHRLGEATSQHQSQTGTAFAPRIGTEPVEGYEESSEQ
jgi:hypothetical protein